MNIIPIIENKSIPNDIRWCEEVSFELHTDCNLKCDFCVQKNSPKSKMSRDLLQLQLKKFEKVLEFSEKRSFAIEIFGGEIFQPKYDNKYYKDLNWFFDQIFRLTKQCGKKIHDIHVATNLLTNNVEQIVDICSPYNIGIFASYDVAGRYTKQWQLERWESNASYLLAHDIPFQVSIVLTRPNVVSIMSQKNNYNIFEWLYNTISDRIFFEAYDCVDETCDDQNYLNQQSYFEFLKYCYHNLPNLTLITELTDIITGKKQKYTDCCRIVQITNYDNYWQCTNSSSWSDVYKKFLSNKRCTECQWFRKCGMMCYRRYLDGPCVKRQMLEYICGQN